MEKQNYILHLKKKKKKKSFASFLCGNYSAGGRANL